MMKKHLMLVTILISSIVSFSQIRIRDRNIKNLNTVVLKENLLDRSPGFKTAPIKFVPLTGDVSKGYDPEKIYTWVNPQTGEQHQAKGKEILAMTNDMEKALNERGHSLREKTPFIKLSLTLPAVAKNDLSKCVITNRMSNNMINTGTGNTRINTKIDKVRINNGRLDNRIKTMMDGTVYSYVGNIITNAREFKQGTLSSTVSLTRNGSSIAADLMLVITPALMNKAANCSVSLAESQNGPVVTTAKLNIKSPSNTIAPSNGYSITYDDCIEPQNMPRDYLMRIYKLELGNTGYTFPAAGTTPKYYYATINFYDANGAIINTYQPNQVVLNNQLPMPINIDVSKQSQYNGFNYELTDPGLHAFGFYAKSDGFTSTFSAKDFGYYGKDRASSISADMNIGIKYFNFERLVNSNAPLSEEFVLFGYKIKSEEKYYKADAAAPPIRIPGSGGLKKEDPDYGVITLLNKEYDLRNTDQVSFTETINKPVSDFRFFIGPVPCRITVDITGSISVTTDYQSSSNSDIKATIIPHADVSLKASGGVDAYSIAYAKIVANVNLLTIDMPYTLVADNTAKTTDIQPTLTVGGLSGQIYFQAGLCIPIPFVDDICTDFRIDILNWKGLEKSIKIDAKNGISL